MRNSPSDSIFKIYDPLERKPIPITNTYVYAMHTIYWFWLFVQNLLDIMAKTINKLKIQNYK